MLEVNFDPFPVLSTERLILRQITENDTNDLFILRSDSRVMQYIDRPLAKSPDDVMKLIQLITDLLNNNEGITWGIVLKSDSKVIGTIGLWRILKEHYRAEIGYLLHPAQQGKGIMQEAFTPILNYGFKTMKLHSIEATVNPENAASIKILERNNFTREAYFKENYFYNGNFLNSAVYSLLTAYK
jgi:ribosomal-protein-alanine N-acetyltransferase